jgi:hypothetical protein
LPTISKLNLPSNVSSANVNPANVNPANVNPENVSLNEYRFTLNPEEHIPSGTVNLSRMFTYNLYISCN